MLFNLDPNLTLTLALNLLVLLLLLLLLISLLVFQQSNIVPTSKGESMMMAGHLPLFVAVLLGSLADDLLHQVADLRPKDVSAQEAAVLDNLEQRGRRTVPSPTVSVGESSVSRSRFSPRIGPLKNFCRSLDCHSSVRYR